MDQISNQSGGSSSSSGSMIIQTNYRLINGTVTVGRSSLQALAGKSLTISDNNITLIFDSAAVNAILSGTNGSLTFGVAKADLSKIPNAKAAVGTRQGQTYTVKDANGKAVANFGKGGVSVTVPYTLQSGEIAGNVQVAYADGSDKVEWLINSSYDFFAKLLRFSTKHFSVFGVDYRQNTPKFTDTSGHWAKDDIAFVTARGLLTGTIKTRFGPDTNMTRGMSVASLGRLAGVGTTKYSNTKFTDVAATAYYAPYVAWANGNGTTDTTFSPDQADSRPENH